MDGRVHNVYCFQHSSCKLTVVEIKSAVWGSKQEGVCRSDVTCTDCDQGMYGNIVVRRTVAVRVKLRGRRVLDGRAIRWSRASWEQQGCWALRWRCPLILCLAGAERTRKHTKYMCTLNWNTKGVCRSTWTTWQGVNEWQLLQLWTTCKWLTNLCAWHLNRRFYVCRLYAHHTLKFICRWARELSGTRGWFVGDWKMSCRGGFQGSRWKFPKEPSPSVLDAATQQPQAQRFTIVHEFK